MNEWIDSIIVEYTGFPYARDSTNNIPKNEINFLVSDSTNNIPKNEINFLVSDDTLLDFLLTKIRSKMIAYETMKKKRKTLRN